MNSQWDYFCSTGWNIIRVDHECEEHNKIEEEGQQQQCVVTHSSEGGLEKMNTNYKM